MQNLVWTLLEIVPFDKDLHTGTSEGRGSDPYLVSGMMSKITTISPNHVHKATESTSAVFKTCYCSEMKKRGCRKDLRHSLGSLSMEVCH